MAAYLDHCPECGEEFWNAEPPFEVRKCDKCRQRGEVMPPTVIQPPEALRGLMSHLRKHGQEMSLRQIELAWDYCMEEAAEAALAESPRWDEIEAHEAVNACTSIALRIRAMKTGK